MSARTRLLLVAASAALLAAVPPAIAAGEAPAADPGEAPVLRLEPQVSPLTLFESTERIKISNRDVSFEVPPDYQESFSFWTKKMRGVVKEEKVEFIIMTREPAADGSVPFRRQLPRYDMEILKPGQTPAVLSTQIQRAVTSKVWEGTLDRYGNVIAMEETAGEENGTLKDLSFPFLDYLYPTVDGPKDLRIGEGFTTRTRGNLPTRLTISGLEDTGLILIRTYTLKKVGPGTATFEVTSNIEVDPDRPPTRERITCIISGSGSGEAVFDRENRVFISSRLNSSLTIEIKAPLRKLPIQAEDFDPGLGVTRIMLDLAMGGKRTVTRQSRPIEAPAPAAN